MINSTSPVGNTMKCLQCELKKFSVFKDCPEDLLSQFFSNKTLVHFKKGDTLITQGENFKGVFCIQRGVVKVSKGSRNREFILWIATPGDIIGLDSFINAENYFYNASAVDDVSACFIPASDFKNILAKDPSFSIRLMKDLCNKINFIEDRITSMSRKKIKEQFAEVLISLAARGQRQPDGNIPVKYSVRDLANIIGTSKNYLYKILYEFSDQKILAVKNKKLFITDFEKLRHVAIGGEVVY